MTSAKVLRGLRGATTATANTSEAILEATEELLRALQDANGFEPGDVESAIFTSSPDLTAEYPARAARRTAIAATAWRAVHAEADGLPSLIIDKYGPYIVTQLLSAGLETARADVLTAIREVFGPDGILL